MRSNSPFVRETIPSGRGSRSSPDRDRRRSARSGSRRQAGQYRLDRRIPGLGSRANASAANRSYRRALWGTCRSATVRRCQPVRPRRLEHTRQTHARHAKPVAEVDQSMDFTASLPGRLSRLGSLILRRRRSRPPGRRTEISPSERHTGKADHPAARDPVAGRRAEAPSKFAVRRQRLRLDDRNAQLACVASAAESAAGATSRP